MHGERIKIIYEVLTFFTPSRRPEQTRNSHLSCLPLDCS